MTGGLFLGICSIALLISAGVCIFAKPLAHTLCVMDMPDGANGRKRHRRPTPLVGGIAVSLPVVFSLLFLQPGLNSLASVTGIVTIFMLLIGFFDDRRDLNPGLRFGLSAFVIMGALALVPDLRLEVLYFSFLDRPYILAPVIAGAFTLLCLLGLQNAVNMADGKNGLVIGICMIWTGFLLYCAPLELRLVLTVLLMSLSVTFMFNVRGRLFLGDAGSYSISVLIGLLSIYVFNHSTVELPADLIVLWFLIPTCDCIRLIATRVSLGRAPFVADRSHFHHIIYDSMPWRYGLTLYLGLIAVPGGLATFWPELTLPMIVLVMFSYYSIYVTLTRRQSLAGEIR